MSIRKHENTLRINYLFRCCFIFLFILGRVAKLTNTCSTWTFDLSAKRNTDAHLWPWGDLHCRWGHSLGGLCDHAGGSLNGRRLGHTGFYPTVEKRDMRRMRGAGLWYSFSLLTNWRHGWKRSVALCWAFTYKGYDCFLTPPRDLSQPMASQWIC